MTTRQLYYLVIISDLGNLSNAAQVLGISQPALSKFLTEYEDSIGFLLFIRYHRRLIPTAVGRYVIEYAQKILDEQTRMLQTLRAVTDANHTRIRLATAPNRGAIIYSKIYNQFSRRYPNISLSLTELYARDQPNSIVHGQIDLSIGSGSASDKVTELPIAYEELLISLPVSHPLAQKEKIRLTDLRDTPFVLQGSRHSIRIIAEKLFQEAGFQPVVAFESNDVFLVDSMLHQAVGAGLVSQAHVFPCDELVYRPLDPPVHQTLHIRYPLGHALTEPERYLAGLLIRERLNDPRYIAIPSAQADELLNTVIQDSEYMLSNNTLNPPQAPAATAISSRIAQNTAPEINLNTEILSYIIAIVDEKSLTLAAEKFYLTQPALSRHLRNVENMLCTKLFTRIHNRLQPTNAGKIFVNFARNILQLEAEMIKRISTYRQGDGGGLYLHCDPLLKDIVCGQIKNKFHQLHPDVQLHITECNQEDVQKALLNASADLGLYFSCTKEFSILNSQILAKSELVYCFGATVPDDYPYSQNISGQIPSRKIMLAPAGSALRTEQDRLMNGLYMTSPSIVCEAQPEILQLLAQTGVADTILPVSFLPEKTHNRWHSFEKAQNYYLILATHPGRHLPPSAKDLIRLMYENLSSTL